VKYTDNLDRITLPDEGALSPAEEDYALNVAVVYQDASTRKWAEDVCGRVTELTGSGGIRTHFCRLGDLTQPQIFPGAVQVAALADVIIVSAYAANELHCMLFAWIDAWLRRRRPGPGTLLALISMLDHPDFQTSFLRKYLQAVARKGYLDFLPHERKLPVGVADSCLKEEAGRAGVSARVLHEVLSQGHGNRRCCNIGHRRISMESRLIHSIMSGTDARAERVSPDTTNQPAEPKTAQP
jgi:hypothetical protein